MILKNIFKRELKGCTIYDNYIQNSSIDKAPIEYLLFSVGKHYYCISFRFWYVINEIEEPTRDAYEVTPTITMGRAAMSEYLKRLKITNMEN